MTLTTCGVGESGGSDPNLDELQADLCARLNEFELAPEAGYSWDQVKAKLKDGSWRAV